MPLITSSYPMTPVPGTCRDQQDERCWAGRMFLKPKVMLVFFGHLLENPPIFPIFGWDIQNKLKLLFHGPKWLSESRKIVCFGLVS